MGGQIVGVKQVRLLAPDEAPEPGARAEGADRMSLVAEIEWTILAAQPGPAHPIQDLVAMPENHENVMALALKSQGQPLGGDLGAANERSDARETDLERPAGVIAHGMESATLLSIPTTPNLFTGRIARVFDPSWIRQR